MNPAWQKRIQADIDTLFGGRDPSEWSYTDNVGRLFESSINAVINESRFASPFRYVHLANNQLSSPAIISTRQHHSKAYSFRCFPCIEIQEQGNPRPWQHNVQHPSGEHPSKPELLAKPA
jgi:hypothetical protein